MSNTALRAEKKQDSRTITFKNKEHEKFYKEYLTKCRYQDVYHKALVYCLGIDRDTRNHVDRIYDFRTGNVKPECLHEGWQTSGSVKIVRMAVNYCGAVPKFIGRDLLETWEINGIDYGGFPTWRQLLAANYLKKAAFGLLCNHIFTRYVFQNCHENISRGCGCVTEQ